MVVNEFSIGPSIITNSLIGDELLYIYQINICYPGAGIVPGATIDMNILKKKLEEFIKPEDRNYIKIKSFDKSRVTYVFDIESWLDDCLKNVKPTKSIMYFSRFYKLNKHLPAMVACNTISARLDKYIQDGYKKYAEKHPEPKKGIMEIIPEKFANRYGMDLFEYKYEYQLNRVVVRLKGVYYYMVLAAMNEFFNKEKTSVVHSNFDKNVYTMLRLWK